MFQRKNFQSPRTSFALKFLYYMSTTMTTEDVICERNHLTLVDVARLCLQKSQRIKTICLRSIIFHSCVLSCLVLQQPLGISNRMSLVWICSHFSKHWTFCIKIQKFPSINRIYDSCFIATHTRLKFMDKTCESQAKRMEFRPFSFVFVGRQIEEYYIFFVDNKKE